MRRFGIIGYPLGHSFSKSYFEHKFEREGLTDCRFDNYEIEHLVELPKNFSGLSVTIPHKQTVIPLLNSIDPVAREIGAVNCIDRHGRGYNTDAIGFEQSLLGLVGGDRPPALVLGGTGGAARAVVYVLAKLGIDYVTVSRFYDHNVSARVVNSEREKLGSESWKIGRSSGIYDNSGVTYDDLTSDIIAHRRLIINATPLGMYPNVDAMPIIPYQAIGTSHYLFDLVYNPEQTAFMKLGRAHGAAVANGLEMLHIQAQAAWELWSNH